MVTASPNGAIHAGRALVSVAAFRALRRPIIKLEVPEFKQHPDDPDEPMPFVFLRAMSDGEKEEWQMRNFADDHYEPDIEKVKQKERQKTYRQVLHRNRPDLMSMCLVDEQGQRVFSVEDIEALTDLHSGGTQRIYLKCRELCGLDEPKPAAEDVLGNSSSGRSASSSGGFASLPASPTDTPET